MLVIVGLGNPGAQYAANRHNIGFMAVDQIQRSASFSPWSKKFKAEIAEGAIAGEKVLLMKPQTYMNLSGEAVGEAMRFYKLAPKDLIVIHDELDLPAGKVRLKVGGGHGGHNGLKSIDAHCGKDYKRVRLGIGHPGSKEAVNGHVLGNFAKADSEWLEHLLDELARNADMLVKGEDSQLQNKLALALGQDAEKAKPEKKPAQQSHIRQARGGNSIKLPESGPMADMLRKLFADKK
ncbi:aminoacyl-tRNA hydrolase [Oryzifoliimicrobium ureilyticus]|uniref:aminoacyl-tRNA hydrolase n=1 Tax=Oryzifoliimicrobium ureilyticus TaxID=3113724 RepID=UPI00307676E1